jgi:hypothetical protein
MELTPEVEDEVETLTYLGLPSASPVPLSNPSEQDYLGIIRPWL